MLITGARENRFSLLHMEEREIYIKDFKGDVELFEVNSHEFK